MNKMLRKKERFPDALKRWKTDFFRRWSKQCFNVTSFDSLSVIVSQAGFYSLKLPVVVVLGTSYSQVDLLEWMRIYIRLTVFIDKRGLILYDEDVM